MRVLPKDVAAKVALIKQTIANNANPSSRIILSRPKTTLEDDFFLERQEVLTAAVTDTDIAVCHPLSNHDNTKISIAYIQNGGAYVVTSITRANMAQHSWVDSGFMENADSVAIAYDGTMPKDDLGTVEFVTEAKPWVFWTDSGSLYARKLGTDDTFTLAETGCTDVAATRAMWSSIGQFDFGLAVFFLLNGQLYYRQYISGEWKDAEYVSSVAGNSLSGFTFTEISVSRTWDYRIVVQLLDSTGNLHELYTQFMGIGKQNTEHLQISDITASSVRTAITYHNTELDERVEITNIQSVSPYGGLYSTALPVITRAYNINDGNGDWGKQCIFVINSQIRPQDLASQAFAFQIIDINNIAYSASSIQTSADGLVLTLYFEDFNNARGVCKASYVPGTVISMNGDTAQASYSEFTPQNLVPSEIPLPEVEAIWNE